MWSNDFDDLSVGSKRKKRKINHVQNNHGSYGVINLKEPRSVEDLITHPKKISEVRNWLEHSLNFPEILLISGPTGSAKSVTLNLVAKSLGIEVMEWINPVDKQEFDLDNWLEEANSEPAAFKELKQLERFEMFSLRSGRYQTLFAHNAKQIILVEDFPNHFIWKPNLFFEFMKKYKKYGNYPIVFICTDDEKLNLLNCLFPNSVKECLNIHNIKFNPISQTALVKALQQSAVFLSEETIVDIAKASNGDIRTALADLQFLVADTVRQKKIPVLSKDVSTDFFQTLGRVLYPKRKDELLSDGSIFFHDVNNIAEHYNHTFLSMIHENFLNTFSNVKEATNACEILSVCDIFNNVSDELKCYAGLTCVIGMMLCNKHPKRGNFQPLSRSRWATKLKNADNRRQYPKFQLTNKTLSLDVIPYLKTLPKFAGSILNSDADRLRNKYSRKVEKVFKEASPVAPSESEEEWTIEEFDD